MQVLSAKNLAERRVVLDAMAGVKDETVANAQSVTPVGAFMVQEFLLNETSPISESEEMHKEIIGRIHHRGTTCSRRARVLAGSWLMTAKLCGSTTPQQSRCESSFLCVYAPMCMHTDDM